MENAKEENNWTEETVMPHLFKMVVVCYNGVDWLQPKKLVGFSHKNKNTPFVVDLSDDFRCSYKFMRPFKEKKKVIEPWTFETCPWPLSLKHKGLAPECLTFSTKRSTGVLYAGTFYAYEYLVEFFQQLDGSPCGTVREVDA